MNISVTETLGKRLKFLRNEKGINQDIVAKEINTSRSCISNYESGNREPDNETIVHFADYYNVSLDYLFGRSTIKNLLTENTVFAQTQTLLTQYEALTTLDMRNLPAYLQCAVVDLYAYLLKKEHK